MNTEQTKNNHAVGRSDSNDRLGAIFGLMMDMETLINKQVVLGVEYQTGNITPYRFAKRIHELLMDYQENIKHAPNV